MEALDRPIVFGARVSRELSKRRFRAEIVRQVNLWKLAGKPKKR